ncbi:hypothetical protein AYI68_g4114 [Smittium mucronatum]|uniref:Uncharacterized protein n=1 Tax=Smittium mucronatum TaxID=133383 RepID=A0A1R0GY17_9FUNG|nr:hypothetical protein AYI68_g4114 [Smittium mucronatum]
MYIRPSKDHKKIDEFFLISKNLHITQVSHKVYGGTKEMKKVAPREKLMHIEAESIKNNTKLELEYYFGDEKL